MARLSIILMFMIWLSWTPPESMPASPTINHLAIPFGVLLAAILGVGLYSRIMSRRLTGPSFHRDMRWYNRVMRIARIAIPAWFGLLVYVLNYPAYVLGVLKPLERWPIESPAFVLGTLPAMLAWVGLWWAAYPADRTLREQNLLVQLEADMPIRRGPTILQYLAANIRLQLLFIYAPILCILVLRDLIGTSLSIAGVTLTQGWHMAISFAAMLPVMLMAPLMLVRILPTEPLEPSPLRERLEELCSKNGLKVSNILLWKTGSNIGNAAVMGILPRWRYLLVTDLLLETMPDEQVLAVFAHEIGHVVHRHLLWMAACAFAIMFVVTGPLESAFKYLERFGSIPEPYSSLAAMALVAPLFVLLFGMVVRRLERQADVFAARTIPQLLSMEVVRQGDMLSLAGPLAYEPNQSFVRSYGATLVCGALKRVALINNVPIGAHEWLHGSIASRIKFLLRIGDDPQQTWRFDRYMRRMFLGIVALFVLTGGWSFWNLFRQ